MKASILIAISMVTILSAATGRADNELSFLKQEIDRLSARLEILEAEVKN